MTTSAITTREQYLDLFGSTTEAVDFETACLSIAREFLAPSARIVLDGGEPTPDYWSWLSDQIDSDWVLMTNTEQPQE